MQNHHVAMRLLCFCLCGAVALNGTDESNASKADKVADVSGNVSETNSTNTTARTAVFANSSTSNCAEPELDLDDVECINASNSSAGPEESTSSTFTTTITKNMVVMKGEGYEFVHDGHCAGGWRPPNSQQSSLRACRDECASRADIGYFAFDGAGCACYLESSGCPDDNGHAAYNAYRVLPVTTTTTETSTPASSTTATSTSTTLTHSNFTTSSAPMSTTRSSPRENSSMEIFSSANSSAESSISVSMTLNVDYQQLGADDKVELKGKIRDVLAEIASVDQAAVSVTLTPGSVKVDAEIQTTDANSAKSIEKAMDKNSIAQIVLEAANSIPGVKAAATGELKVTGLEVKTVKNASENAFPQQNASLGFNNYTALFEEPPLDNDETSNSMLKWVIVGVLLMLLLSGTTAWLVSRRHHSLPQCSDPGVEGKADIEKGSVSAIVLPAIEPLAQEDFQDKLDKISGSTQAVEDTDSQEVADVCSSSSIVVDISAADEQFTSHVEGDKVAHQKNEHSLMECRDFQCPEKMKEDEASPAVSTFSNATLLEALDPLKAEGEDPNLPESPVSLPVPAERLASSMHPEPASEPQGWSVFSFPSRWFPTSCAKPTTEGIRSISRASSLMDTHEPCQIAAHEQNEPSQIAAPEQSEHSDRVSFHRTLLPASCSKPTSEEIPSISQASSLLDAHEPCQIAAQQENPPQHTEVL